MGKEGASAAPTPNQRFDLFIGIDYSGARTASAPLKGLQVYGARAGWTPEKWTRPQVAATRRTGNWSRVEVARLLLERAQAGERFIAGIDHCFSMPWAYFERYGLGSWPAFLDDFVTHWPTHEHDASVDGLRAAGLRSGTAKELRLAETWTSSAKSVFQFDMQGSVAKSSHAGIPWLKWLRDQAGDRLHVWPFDGWDPAPGKSVIAEMYPSMLKRRYPAAEGMSADQHDAFSIASWLADMAGRGALVDYLRMPPLTGTEQRVAACEGWVLGVR